VVVNSERTKIQDMMLMTMIQNNSMVLASVLKLGKTVLRVVEGVEVVETEEGAAEGEAVEILEVNFANKMCFEINKCFFEIEIKCSFV
jgi:hypothetical protein